MTFTAPVMTFSKFELNPDFKDEGQGLSAEIHFHHSVNRLDDQNTAVVALRLQINQKLEKKASDAPFWLEVEYAAQFGWDEGLSEEEIDRYLHINASAVLIGYIRPLVANLTSSSPLPIYTLPFINANDLFQPEEGN